MTKPIKIKNLIIGGGAPITVQSMTNTPPHDAEKTVAQINALAAAGCDIVRVTVPDQAAASVLPAVLNGISVPLVADIHFDYRLAVAAIEHGVHKIRFNPGNIGSQKNVATLAACAKAHRVPIRVGVNGGSLEKDILDSGKPLHEKLVESALRQAALLEKHGFDDIVLSVKSSSVQTTVAAYELLSRKTQYPLHVGVTEAGTYENALVKSAVGIGALLIKDIGDTVRVSIAGDPLQEPRAALAILRACNKLPHVEVVACPTCGRCHYDVERIAKEVETRTVAIRRSLKIAVMGCVVNGPGEAADADLGIAGGGGQAVIIQKGKVIKTVSFEHATEALMDELGKLLGE